MAQRTLAELAGISDEAVSSLERGFRRVPRGQTLTSIINALALGPKEAERLIRAASPPPRPRRRQKGARIVDRLGNLPSLSTKLVGRSRDLQALKDLLSLKHLVTIVGTGGIGKTQMALTVARDLEDAFADGVWIVELASVTKGDDVAATIAGVLDLSLLRGGPANDALADNLSTQSRLIVLDNCEHVAHHVASLVDAIRQRCPNIRILATSRASIGAVAEMIYLLPTLSCPENGSFASLEETASFDAVTLFVQRAREVDPAFRLTNENAHMVAEICRRLDGIALAIELAARRTRALSLDDVLARLNRRFRLLTGGSTLVARHETLLLLFNWSYDLLTVDDQRFFDGLGVFPGSFSLDAARSVALDHPHDEFDALDRLESLISKSLVVRLDGGAGHGRYALLETLREFAVDRLAASGRTEEKRGDFFRYVHERFTAAGEAFEHDPRDEVIARVEIEIDSRLAALDIARERGDVLRGAELLLATPFPEGMQDYRGEMAGRFAEQLSDTHTALLSRLWACNAMDGSVRSTDGADTAKELALAYARASGDLRALANALQTAAKIDMRLERFTSASAALRESESLPLTAALAYFQAKFSALLTRFAGNPAVAARQFRTMAITEQSRGNVNYEFDAHLNRAEAEFADGQTARAVEVAQDAERLIDGMDRGRRAHLNTNYAAYLVHSTDFSEARKRARQVFREAQDLVFYGYVLEHLALAHALEGRLESAATLYGIARSATAEFSSDVRGYTEFLSLSKLLERLDAMNADDRARAQLRGGRMSRETALAFALSATI